MDFGDAASALIVRITQKKFVSPKAELEATKHTVLNVENTQLSIVLAGDSICVSTLYNPGLNIKNILLRSTVVAVKDKCQDIIKIFPNATILLCWMDGKSNAADSTSKLTYDNINIINSKLYREGPIQLHEDEPERVVFYRVTKDKEE